ncbi:hypothetical protein DSM112329_01679 [Paraconexibacter sp. AEG42_29]|uniref:Uncharacterized protein n=1 Tax=Paraconexibacter sp. AEG42_29 TaxID=2997339 RepID=A0AAU7ATB5_9ACTN
MSHFRRTALVSATAALIFTAAAPSAMAADSAAPGSEAAATDGLLGLPDLPIVSTLPIVGGLLGGGTTGTPAAGLPALPTLPGLEILNTVLQAVPVLGSDPAAALGTLPSIPVASDLLAALTGAAGGSGGDPLSSLVSALTGLTGALPAGGLPTDTVPLGSALKPATDLLRQVAAVVPEPTFAAALKSLADQIDAVGDAGISPELLTVLASTLGSISQTDGVPAPVQGAAGGLAAALSPAASQTTTPKPGTTTPTTGTTKPVVTTTTTTKPGTTTTPGTTGGTTAAKPPVKLGRVSVSSVKIDRAKGTLAVTLKCPATGPACLTIVTAYRGSALAGSLPLTYIASGGSVTKKLKLNSASRKALKAKTTKFKVGALLQGGSVASKSLTTKAPAKKKAARKAAKR